MGAWVRDWLAAIEEGHCSTLNTHPSHTHARTPPPSHARTRVAIEEGHFAQGRLTPGLARAEVNLHAMTAGVAMLSLYSWLHALRALVLAHGTGGWGVGGWVGRGWVGRGRVGQRLGG